MLQIPNVTELEGQSEDEGAAVTRATEDTPSGENGTFALSLSDLDFKGDSKRAAANSPSPAAQLIITHHHHHHTRVTTTTGSPRLPTRTDAGSLPPQVSQKANMGLFWFMVQG